MIRSRKILKIGLSVLIAILTILQSGVFCLAAETESETDRIELLASAAVNITGGSLVDNYEGKSGVSLLTDGNNSADWSFEAEAGTYKIGVEYFPENAKSSAVIARTLQVNQTEAVSVNFTRRWVNNLGENESFQTDIYGNEIRPTQKLEPTWLYTELYDSLGESDTPITFELKDGVNTLCISGTDDPLVISKIILTKYEPLNSYKDTLTEWQKSGAKPVKDAYKLFEAENAIYKSDATIYPAYERSSVNVTPANPTTQKVNVIGGAGWSTVGQYVVFEIEVEEDGLYSLAFNYRKDVNQGISSFRRLYIDGVVPFEEANAVEFKYSAGYTRMVVSGNDGPYQFYLTKGKHELKLEASLGSMTDIVSELSDTVYNLNSIYRRIIVVTGTSPDFYRDYEFESKIPDVIEDIGKEIIRIENIYDTWLSMVDSKGNSFSTLDLILKTLRAMRDDPETIATKLSALKTQIGSCGTLLKNMRNCQLQLDSIELFADESNLDKYEKGFFSQLLFSLKATLYSFVADYNGIGTMNSGENLEEITVWVTGGREQYELLKNLTHDGTLEKEGVKANLRLVGNVLLQAIVADIAPDVMLTSGSSDIINYALRGALLELNDLEGFSQVRKNYADEAFVPLTLENKTYGIPVNMAYNVLFYRIDILNDLGIEIPKTWDEVTKTITLLNKNSLEFGIPFNTETYFALLTQKGGSMYNDSGSKVAFDSQLGVDSFGKFTRYFTDYGQQITYDAQNRFRTGEMPLVIADFTFFNNLSVAAPEIAGLWDFTYMPGTIQSDGSIDRTACLTVTASIILKSSKNPDASWKFLKWWTSADIQTDYGRTLESILGPSSRYAAANIETMNNMAWTSAQKEILFGQLYESKAIPEVPGGYLMSRELNYAFRRVVNEGADPKDTLLEYAKTINNELTAKRKEFGFETEN